MMRRRPLTGLAAAIALLQANCSDSSNANSAADGVETPADGGAYEYPDGGEPRDGRKDASPPDAGTNDRDSAAPNDSGAGDDGGSTDDGGATDGGNDSGNDSGGPLIVGGGVIALEDEPGPRPYLQTPTDHSMWISWWTDSGTESVVEYGTSEGALDHTVSGSSTDLAPGAATYHLVKIDGLSADTRYWYRVKTGTNISRVYRFRTLPPLGDKKDHFRFLIMGDHQIIDEPRHTKMVAAARDKVVEKFGGYIEDAVRLNVNVGDQVDVGNVDHWRNLHFKQSALLTPYIPTTTIIGNHETYYDSDLALYKQLFAYEEHDYAGIAPIASDTEKYYALRAANLLFVMTDTEHTSSDQTTWVDRIITQATDDTSVDWVFTLGHRPYQAEQYVGDISTWIRNTVAPIVTRTPKSVALIGGHHHLFARGQLRNSPVYNVISGGTAWDQYWGQSNEQDFDDVQKTIDFWPYQIVDIDQAKNDLLAETYAMGSPKLGYFSNTLIDTFHRRKDQSAPHKPTVTDAPAAPLTPPFTLHSSAYATDTTEPFNSTEFQVSSSTSFASPEIDLYRDYEDLFGTTGAGGTPQWWWVDKNKDADLFALTVPQGKLSNGQYSMRVRHRDRNLEWSPWSDAVAFTVTGSVQATPTVTTDKTRYPKGSTIGVQWANGPANAKDWVGIYRDGDTPGAGATSTTWKYTPTASGSTTFTLTANNFYWVNLFENDGYKELANRAPFYYGDIPVLTVTPATYDVGQTVTVNLASAPALAKDWVGVYRAGQNPGKDTPSVKWAYAPGATGSLDFTGLAKGYYYATYMLKDGYFEPGDRVSFQVGTTIATLSAPGATFAVGTPVTFYFTDGPAIPKDYVGIFKKGATPGIDKLVSYLYFGGTASGSVTFRDLEAGEYFAALYTNDSYTEVSNRVAFTVTP